MQQAIQGFGVRQFAVHRAGVRTITKPTDMLPAEWQSMLAVADRALFAYRLRTERERQQEEQRDLVEDSGIPQQTWSEWERGVRVHITTEMQHMAAYLTGLHIMQLLERPATAHTAEGRVFWTAVEEDMAALRLGRSRTTVPELLRRAEFRILINGDGQILLDPVVVMSEREVWLYKNPEAMASVLQGVRDAAAGDVHDLGSFAHAASDDADDA